jgi:hypothetical protein|tara:strand:- start:5111 stop:5446 length:336 start_codon:yes stop_codon:yes gene_type:complete
MNKSSKNWTKHELKIYLLLLCAQADSVQTQDELALIKRKTDSDTFAVIHQEFNMDDEDTSIEKIERSIAKLDFSQMELAELKKEIHELFQMDKKFSAAERYLDKILDNIVY